MPDESKMTVADEPVAFDVEDGAETLRDQYLIFLSDGLHFGVSAEYVVEILTNYAITHLPMVPHYVRGIINLRGQIIPIIDIRLRLGKPSQEDNCIVVINVAGTQLGILVDTVEQMITIPKGSVSPMPANNDQKLVSGMCTLPDGSGTMMVLDCVLLVSA